VAEVVRYVDPDAVANGNDGTTWAKAYLSLAAWEAAEGTDLVTAGNWHHVYCRSSGGTADITEVEIVGWTTGVNNYVLIEAASGDEAIKTGWDATRYRLSVTDPTTGCIVISEEYIRLKGLQIEVLYTAQALRYAIYSLGVGASNLLQIYNCRIRGDANASSTAEAIRFLDGNHNVQIWNCIFENLSGRGLIIGGTNVEVYNTIIYNCGSDGIYGYSAGNWIIKNCVVFKNTDDFNDQTSGTWAISYCASDDNDTTDETNIAESGGGVDWSSDFVDAANGDFTLLVGSNLVGAGTVDPGSGLFSDDIEGDARGVAWDLGVDEYVAVGGTVAPTGTLYGPLGGPVIGVF